MEEHANAIGLEDMNDEAIDRYKNPDNDPRGVWTSVPAIAQGGHGTKAQFYTLTSPKGLTFDPPSGSCWRYTQERMQQAIADNRIWFGSDGAGVPRIKKFLSEGKQGLTPETLLAAEKVGTNDSAKRELVSLFDGIAVFETPKPVSLIRYILSICNRAQDGIFIDFFSGTTPLNSPVAGCLCMRMGRKSCIWVLSNQKVAKTFIIAILLWRLIGMTVTGILFS